MFRFSIFCLVYVQILHVYEPAYQTGGQFWPHIHVRIIVFLVFLQICFIGVFTVKGLGHGSFFVVPLPIFTLLFNEYCRKRFFPAFRHFNMEVAAPSLFLVSLPLSNEFCVPDCPQMKIQYFLKQVLECICLSQDIGLQLKNCVCFSSFDGKVLMFSFCCFVAVYCEKR